MSAHRIALAASALTLLAACAARPEPHPTGPPSLTPTAGQPGPTALDHSRPGGHDHSRLVDPPQLLPQTQPTGVAPSEETEAALDALEPPPTAYREPKRPEPPPDRSDPIAVALFVAELWSNAGPGLAPWHVGARPFLTDELAAAVAATRPLDEDVQISSQVIATTTDDSGPTRVTVTMEQTVSIDAAVETHVTLSVVELLLVADEPGWLVGSLERIA